MQKLQKFFSFVITIAAIFVLITWSFVAAFIFWVVAIAVVGLAMGAFQIKAENAEEIRKRRNRPDIDKNDAMYWHQVLLRFGLIQEDINKSLIAEAAETNFSSVPYSERKVRARLEDSDLDEADLALESLASRNFLDPVQAQVIQQNLDKRLDEGRTEFDAEDEARLMQAAQAGDLVVLTRKSA